MGRRPAVWLLALAMTPVACGAAQEPATLEAAAQAFRTGQYEDAERSYEEAIRLSRRVLGMRSRAAAR